MMHGSGRARQADGAEAADGLKAAVRGYSIADWGGLAISAYASGA
jgi:hypothetical protein